MLDYVGIIDIKELTGTFITCAKIVTQQLCKNQDKKIIDIIPAWKTWLWNKLGEIRWDWSNVIGSKYSDNDVKHKLQWELIIY